MCPLGACASEALSRPDRQARCAKALEVLQDCWITPTYTGRTDVWVRSLQSGRRETAFILFQPNPTPPGSAWWETYVDQLHVASSNVFGPSSHDRSRNGTKGAQTYHYRSLPWTMACSFIQTHSSNFRIRSHSHFHSRPYTFHLHLLVHGLG